MDEIGRTYHVIVDMEGCYPDMETELVPHFMGTKIDPSFFLYGTTKDFSTDKDIRYMGITIEEPYDHGDGTYYTSIVPSEQDMIEAVIRTAQRELDDGYDLVDNPRVEHICKVGEWWLYKATINIEESNPSKKHYDQYYINVYFIQ